LKIPRIVAITDKDNETSGRLLEKIGLRFERLIEMPGDRKETKLFVPNESQ
jgi:RimJ/RimL family protein N-acetyltransferase